MKRNRALVGFLDGITTRALLGVLYTPEKGIKTPKKTNVKAANILNQPEIK